ncbi:MAG: S9 family peptidase [Candidatus Manganitrophus sp. SA1]|nr:S9 family peptidase [Candidatus Manganitrophus morganii]
MKFLRLIISVVFLVLFYFNNANAELPPLIPKDVLFGNPERINAQLSPDGQYLTYVSPDEKNVQQIWIRTVGREDDKILTADKNRGIRRYSWAYDNQHLLYMKDSDGDENYHLYSVNIQTGLVRDLTPFEGKRAQLIAVDPAAKNELLVTINLKDRRKADLYRINLTNGATEFDAGNPGNIVGWVPDAQFKVRAATATTSEGGFEILYRDDVDQPWKSLRRWGPDDEGQAISFSSDNKMLFAITSHDANAVRLISIDLQKGNEAVLAEDPQYDISTGEFEGRGEGTGVIIHPTKKIIQAVSFYRETLQWQALDKTISTDFEVLRNLHKGQISINSRDLSDNIWIVSYNRDDGPTAYYLYDRKKQTGKLLFMSEPRLEGLQLASMKPISFISRDGLTIHGYLTTPVGIPTKNLPTVLLVHGGPWARDTWGFNPQVQWLANRGYAVLQVNYRGSRGYGKNFLKAGNKEWGGKMQEDLVDATQWIVKQGLADPKRIAIMGRSYGGYAVLAGLTFTPDLFAAGVDIVGPSNLSTLLKSIPPHFAPMKAMFSQRVGDPESEADLLKSRSPLFFVDRMKAPLLIAQGGNDPRVKQAESEQIVEAMRKANKPVEYILYPDEGHYFLRPENRIHLNSVIETFLGKHLGGRVEPPGDIKGHSGITK